ncbi:hypothetical protein LTR53_020314, partial [Teratosphaeriaceae sp. CCFEE 6253]
REQLLEQQAKAMSDKVSMLEGKVEQLEQENKWLKDLITEKGKDVLGKTAAVAIDVDALREETGDRSTEGRTDGVGTETQAVKSEA